MAWAMRRGGQSVKRWGLPLLFSAALGCTVFARPSPKASFAPLPLPSEDAAAPSPRETKSIQKVVYTEQEKGDKPPDALPVPRAVESPEEEPPSLSPFADSTELSIDALVEAVLNRNPTLPRMVAAWKAAKTRYPQATSLDDPFFGSTIAPASLGSNGNGNTSGYRFEVFQRYPFPGKLKLRGEKALAEANAVGRDVENTRVQLIESAREGFYDYYLAQRALEINDEGLRLLRKFRDNAIDRYKNASVPQSDVLQADVEIGRQRQRLVSLERAKQVAIARLNTLMHLPPASPLPPPPKELNVDRELPDPLQMRATALNQRLDLLALKDRIAAAEAAVKLAYRDFYPDFDVMAAYDNFWTQGGLRPQLALRINLPVRLQRRYAAVEEAKARLAQLRAEYASQTDVVGYEVQQVYEQLRESQRIVHLFEQEVLSSARKNVESSQASYTAGRIPFLTLIEAERNLVNLRDAYYEAVTELFRRRTVLERTLSGSPPAVPLPAPAKQPGPGQAGYPTSMGTLQGP